jgi:hypothetical protein
LNSDCTSTFAARSLFFSPRDAMMNGAIATFSSPVICSFGFTGSLSLTSITPADAESGSRSAKTMAKRFIWKPPAAVSVPEW